jgi:HK97 family phage prohead protease
MSSKEGRGSDRPRVTGYGAVYYDADKPGTEYALFEDLRERLVPGCFDQTLAEDDIRCLFNHDGNMILGRMSAGTLVCRADNTGLNYDVLPPGARADVCEAIRRFDVTGSSFSFLCREQRWSELPDGTTIREVLNAQVFDVGPVCFPAYEATSAVCRDRLGDGQIERRFLSADICPVHLVESGTDVAGAGHVAADRRPDPHLDRVLAGYRLRAAEILE